MLSEWLHWKNTELAMIPVDARGARKSRAIVDSSTAESTYKVIAG
jgi:hypothetical protein